MSDSQNLLTGIRVIDCGTYIAGPAAAVVMADFGAEVIKIERPPYGDPYRYLSLLPGMPASEHLFCWILDGRNKKSVALNLEEDSARDALLKLVATADVFITNYQPALVRKFRLAYEELRRVNARLIYAQVTGFGERGDEAEKPAYDQTAYWAHSGLMFTMHNADAEPVAHRFWRSSRGNDRFRRHHAGPLPPGDYRERNEGGYFADGQRCVVECLHDSGGHAGREVPPKDHAPERGESAGEPLRDPGWEALHDLLPRPEER